MAIKPVSPLQALLDLYSAFEWQPGKTPQQFDAMEQASKTLGVNPEFRSLKSKYLHKTLASFTHANGKKAHAEQ